MVRSLFVCLFVLTIPPAMLKTTYKGRCETGTPDFRVRHQVEVWSSRRPSQGE